MKHRGGDAEGKAAPIDIEQVRSILHNHRDHLREELACTERAIEMLGRSGMPMLFPDGGYD